MKIGFKNILDHGDQKIQISKIEGVSKRDSLPFAYILPDDYCTYIEESGELWVEAPEEKDFGGQRIRHLKVGDVVSPELKEWIIETMTKAGKRLHDINMGINELKKNWEGKEVEVII